MLRLIETPTFDVYTASYTVTEGKTSVTIITNSSFVGTICGGAGVASTTYYFYAQTYVLGAIPIVITAGGFTVLTTATIQP